MIVFELPRTYIQEFVYVNVLMGSYVVLKQSQTKLTAIV
jgi:hypothetical protein